MVTLISQRYRAIRELKTGEIGSVYLAEDLLRLRRLVVLKFLRKITPSQLAQFKEEFAVLEQLHHRNLVEVYDFSKSTEPPGYYFTMEYVSGDDWNTLSSRQRAEKKEVDLESIISILSQLCDVLHYVHEHGILHHDIKPGNIRITPGGIVKLVDFGLVRRAIPRQEEPSLRGTPAYIAPEVLRGELATPGSDLYALGVSLYEVLTGDLPARESPDLTLVPKALRPILKKLLAPNPAARYTTAKEVVQDLHHSLLVRHGTTPLLPLQNETFTCRTFELAYLQGALKRARKGQGRVVFLAGETGIGKTRLAHEIKSRAVTQQYWIAEGTCRKDVQVPYYPWVAIFRRFIAHARRTASHKLHDYGAALVQLIPELSDELPHIPKNALVPEGKSVLLTTAIDFLLDSEIPLVLLLENLHYADSETIELLQRLTHRISESHILLLGLYRDAEVSSQHPLYPLTQAAHLVKRRKSQSTPVLDNANIELLVLEPFNESCTRAFVHSMLGKLPGEDDSLPPALLPWLQKETGGNPFFIESLVQSLTDESYLWNDGTTWHLDTTGFVSTTPDIQAITQRQLFRLSRQHLDLLQWAAVMGSWLDVPLLTQLTKMSETEVRSLLITSIRHHILEMVSRLERQTFRFRNEQIRMAIYHTLTEEERRHHHACIAELLLAHFPAEEIAELLTLHFEHAGMMEQALRYAGTAGRKALLVYAGASAAQYFSRALSFIAEQQLEIPPKQHYELLSGRAQAYGMLSQYVQQEADLIEMAQLVQIMDDPLSRVEVMIQQASVATHLGHYSQAREIAEEAIKQARAIQSQQLEALGLDTLGDILSSLGLLEQADQRYYEALRLYRELKDRAGEAHCLWGIAIDARLRGQSEVTNKSLDAALTIYRELGDRPGEADILNAMALQTSDIALQRTYHEQSLAIAQALNDRKRQARTYNNLALMYWALGLYERAYEHAEQALALLEGENDRAWRASFSETLGRIHLATGKYQQAREAFEQGRKIATELGSRAIESVCWHGLGQVLQAEGKPAEAIELFQTAYGIQRKFHLANYLSATLSSMGAAYLTLGDWGKAEQCTGQAITYLGPAGSGEEFPPQNVWWQRYQVLLAAEKVSDTAWEALQHAYQTMMEEAATLSDEGLKRNYLNKVALNREIIIAWTRYTAMLRRSQMNSDIYPSVVREPDPRTDMLRIKTQLQRILDTSSRMNEIHQEGTLFEFIMDQVVELSGAEYGFLATFDFNGQLDYRIAKGLNLDELDQGHRLINTDVLNSVVRSRIPILFQDPPQEPVQGDEDLNLRSLLCVPLLSGPEFIGVLYAGTRSISGRFSQTDLDLMRLFANQAATAIENARLYERMSRANEQLAAWAHILEERVAERTAELETTNTALARRAVQLETNVQVSKQTVSILELNELLRQAATLIQAQFGYYLVGIWLLNESENELKWRAGANSQGQLILNEPWTIPLSEPSIITSVYHTKKLRYAARTQTTKDFKQARQFPNIASELALPLYVGDGVLGVLDIAADHPDAFAEDEQVVFQSLADQLAIAIRNARLYETEQHRRRLAESLELAGRELSSTLSLEEVPARILEHLHTLIPYERGAVFLQDGDTIKILASVGFPDEHSQTLELSVRPGDVYWKLAQKQGPLIIDDVSREPGWQQISGLPLDYSWLGAPLRSRGRTIGMISLTRREKHAFSEEDALWVLTFAAQAGVALENARLYTELHQLSEELESRVEERTQELNRAYHNLERLDKTKSDFINIAAHELRTPLTVVMGYTQMLRRRLATSPDLKALEHVLNGILSGSNRLREIINSMLDIAKIDSGALQVYREHVSIAELSRRIHFELAAALEERNLSLHLDNLGALPWIMADPDLIYKVFYHLVVNAIKYTPDGGMITIQGKIEAKEGQPASILLIFNDTGIGIAPQDQDLIFERFYQTGNIEFHSSGRTKFKGNGPGLGLTIVRGIIQAHGGEIWVESERYDEEQCPGTSFYVRLPIK